MLEGRMGKILTDARVMARRRFFYLGLEIKSWMNERINSTTHADKKLINQCIAHASLNENIISKVYENNKSLT
jgi:hypothetical protein